MRRLGRFVIWIALLATSLAVEAGDRETVLSLLKQYSPDGYFIVDTYMRECGNTDFMEYWDPSSEDSRWDSINTIVHEIAHGYMGELADRNSLYYIASRDERIMVPLTSVFFSREMVPTFPERLRTFRFDTYVNCSEDELGSQAEGAYGLLDEMNAYFIGTKASWDLLPYFRSRGADAPWSSFFSAVNGTLYGILEFKLYVLKYLEYAQANRPAVYRDITANASFAKAFLAVDRASRLFINDYLTGKEKVYAELRALGFEAREEGEYLLIARGNADRCAGTFMDVYTLLAQELEKKEYQELMAKLNAGAAVAAYPTLAAPASSATATSATETKPAVAAAAPQAVSSAAQIALVQEQKDSSASVMAEIRRDEAGGVAPRTGAVLSRGGEDEIGDVATDFIDISRVDISLFPEALIVGISYAAFPGKLIFNNPNLDQDSLEYEWACDIDVEGDGKADFSLSMSSFKAPGAFPVEASVTLFCQADLWKLSRSGGTATETPVKVETAGSGVYLTLGDGRDLPLKKLTSKSTFTVRTYYDDGRSVAEDSLEL
jgi:hypothetical protein